MVLTQTSECAMPFVGPLKSNKLPTFAEKIPSHQAKIVDKSPKMDGGMSMANLERFEITSPNRFSTDIYHQFWGLISTILARGSGIFSMKVYTLFNFVVVESHS